MIRFSNVSKAYHGATQPALQGLNFHLPVGSMTYLVGHSGAGKSTLLKLIMGMEKANAGNIWFNGHDITRLSKYEIPFLRRQIGMVHQDYRLLTDRRKCGAAIDYCWYEPERSTYTCIGCIRSCGLT